MDAEVTFIKNRLVQEGVKIYDFFCSLPELSWGIAIYSEDSNWTIKSIFSHLISAEKGFVEIFKDIKSGNPGVSEDFDIDQFNAEQEKINKNISYSELTIQFKEIRQELIVFVDSLSAEDLKKIGRHPFLGQATLSEMLKLVYRHDQLHLHDIKKLLKS